MSLNQFLFPMFPCLHIVYSVPYGKGEIYFEIPEGFKVAIAEPNPTSSVKNINSTTRETLLRPINSRKLSDTAKGKNTACIVVTDITRACPDKELLPPILEQIEKEINRKDITILIAAGMHREMTYDEKVEKYGKDIVDNYRIIDHNGEEEKNLVYLGITRNGVPIKISKIALESELLVSTGVVEPHQYAGYSGGYKTVAIGVAGDETISHMHSLRMLENPKIRLGNVEQNPFQENMVEIGKKVSLDFIVNVILGKEGEVLKIRAGEPLETFRTLIKEARTICEVPIEKSFDVVICGVGFPKDTNLYQTSRAASYLFFVSNPVVKKGGYIIIPAVCQEGAGKGVGEQRFLEMLKNRTIDEILTQENLRSGEQRAFLMANVLQHCKVIIVGSRKPEVVKDAKMLVARDMKEAFSIIKNDLGSSIEVLVVRNALITLPVIQ